MHAPNHLSAVVLSFAIAILASALPALAWEENTLTEAELVQSDALVVDIRTPEEWAETGVLPGVERLSFADPASFAEAFVAAYGTGLASDREVVLICRSGRRSAAAAEALAARIPNPVISQAGGMSALIEAGAKVVAP